MPALLDATPCESTSFAAAELLVLRSASAAPLRRALAAVAGEAVRRRCWERLSFARLRDYADERAGCSARQLQELARVDTALRELPAIDAELTAGAISWTQARLLCRVAKPTDERAWLELARRSTARALANEVRALDRRSLEGGGLEASDHPDDVVHETVWLRCSSETRSRWWVARQLAQRVAGETLPVWACAEAIAAEVMSATAVVDDPTTQSCDETPAARRQREHRSELQAEPVRLRRKASAATTPFLTALSDGLDGCDAFELDARLRRALRLEAFHLRELGPLLLEVAATRAYRDVGYSGLDAFVREELGMSPSRARALLRLERLAGRCVVFAAAWRSGRLTWTQADALARLFSEVASRPWRRAWIERARAVSVRRLAGDVDEALASGELDPAALGPLPAGLELPGDLQTGAPATVSPETERIHFRAPPAVARLFRAVLSTVQRALEVSEGRALDAMLEHVFEAWGRNRTIPKRYRLFARDGWRCTVPGCSTYRNLQGHHIVYRSRGGPDELSNLTTLCAFHHLRAVHAGTVRITGTAPQRLRFELGLRAGRRALLAFRSGDVRAAKARAS